MNHCVEKIVTLLEQGRDDRRTILQIGYNLGRLSELTGLGREAFWDRWKGPIEAWISRSSAIWPENCPRFLQLPLSCQNSRNCPRVGQGFEARMSSTYATPPHKSVADDPKSA